MTPKERYRAWAAATAELPLCFQPWYLDAVTEGGVWDVALLESNGAVVGVWPYFLKHKFGLPYITMPHFIKWMGPWLSPDPARRLGDAYEIVEKLRLQLPKTFKISIDCHPDFQNWLPLYWAGFRQTTRYTYTLDLSGDYEAGFNRNMRRNIKKAEAELAVSTEGAFDEFYRLNRLSFQRQGKEPTYSRTLLERHIHSLQQNQSVQIFFARDAQKRLHSTAALTWDTGRAYYHLSGDDPELRNSGAGILLVKHAMQWAARELQVPVFDFEGSMMPQVEAIRRQFGAEPMPYHRVWKGL
ncbi:MAG: GNAT family N-acetyltransferase [Saprospiraceae bacterium]|nr:GNAT family N-acetyltransferase [Saprospiraceae bacterium]